MGKHDKTFLTSSEDFYENRIVDLQDRLAFANETVSKLKDELSKYNKYVNEIQDAAERKVTALEAENAKLRGKIVRLVEKYV